MQHSLMPSLYAILKSIILISILPRTIGSCCYGAKNVQVTALTIAGIEGSDGYNNGAGIATSALLNHPYNVWVDDDDNVFFTDHNNQLIRRVTPSGIISIFAGSIEGISGFGGDGNDATSTSVHFNGPWDLVGDTVGNVYITDTNNMRVRKVSASNHIITTVAGSGTSAIFSGATNPLLDTGLGEVFGIDIDPSNRYLFVASSSLCVIWRLDLQQQVAERYAGTGTCAQALVGVLRNDSTILGIHSFWLDPTSGEIILSEVNTHLYLLIGLDGKISRFAGDGTTNYEVGPTALLSSFTGTSAVTGDTLGNVYLAGYTDNNIRKVCRDSGNIEVVYGFDISSTIFFDVYGLFFHRKSGTIYFADSWGHTIQQLSFSGSFAGSPIVIAGSAGQTGEISTGNTALGTPIGDFSSIWVDPDNQVYFTDSSYQLAGKIGTDGIVSILMSFNVLSDPRGIIGDSEGNIYIADTGANLVRMIDSFGTQIVFAGNGAASHSGDNGVATSAGIGNVVGLAIDNDYLYMSSENQCRAVRRVQFSTNIITTFAGTGDCSGISGGNNAQATTVPMLGINGIWMDPATDDLFIAQPGLNLIRKIDNSGFLTIFAGDTGPCCSPAGSFASQSSIGEVNGITGDTAGNIYFAPTSAFTIYKIDRITNLLEVFAGVGDELYIGVMIFPYMHTNGLFYYADISNNVVATICTGGEVNPEPTAAPTTLAPTTLTPTAFPTVAVNESCCYSMNNVQVIEEIIAGVKGDFGFSDGGGVATAALLNDPLNVWVDDDYIVYFTDLRNHVVRKINPSGSIELFAGGSPGVKNFAGDGSDATSPGVFFDEPWDLTGDTLGNVFITDTRNMRVRRVSAADNIITTVAGNGNSSPFDGFSLLSTGLGLVFGIEIDPNSRYLFVASSSLCIIWRLDLQNDLSKRFAGTGTCAPAVEFSFRDTTSIHGVYSLWLDPVTWEIIFSEVLQNLYYLIRQDGIIEKFAGTSFDTYNENELAEASSFTATSAVTGDTLGNVYLAGYTDRYIRKVCRSTGRIEVLYGNGSASVIDRLYGLYFHEKSASIYYGDYGLDVVKKLSLSGSFASNPTVIAGEFGLLGLTVPGEFAVDTRVGYIFSVWVDSSDRVYLGDISSNTVSRIGADGIVSTLLSSFAPHGIVGDTAGNIYLADNSLFQISRYDSNGIVTQFAGSGSEEYSGDGGVATSAGIFDVMGLATDNDYLYLASRGHCTVRRVDFATNIISRFAGIGSCGTGLDIAVASENVMHSVYGIWMDTNTNDLFIAESGNRRIRRVDSTGIIFVFAGDTGSCCSTPGALAEQSAIGVPRGLTGDSEGNIYFAPLYFFDIYKIERSTGILHLFAGNGGNSYIGEIQLFHMHTNGLLYYGDVTNKVVATICTDGEVNPAPTAAPTTLAPTTLTPTAFPTVAFNASCCYGVRNIEVAAETIAGIEGVIGSSTSGVATASKLNNPVNVWVDQNDNIYFTEVTRHVVRKVDAAGNVTVFAGGSPSFTGFGGDGYDATSLGVFFDTPWDLTGDTMGNIYIADSNNRRVRKVSAADHIITTVAGNGNSAVLNNLPLVNAGLGNVNDIDIDPTNRYLFVASSSLCVIWRLDLVQDVAFRYAGSGNCLPLVQGTFRTFANIDGLRGFWLNPSNGEIIFAEENQRVYHLIQTDGIILRFAGNGVAFYSESDQATASGFTLTYAVTGDTLGNVYLAGQFDSRIRKVCRSTGRIEVLYGNGSPLILKSLYGLYFHEKNDSIYYGDYGLDVVKKLSLTGSFASNPTVIAGEIGIMGSTVEGALAVNSRVGMVSSVWVDSSDQIYFSDMEFGKVSRIGIDGIVSTLIDYFDPRAIVGDTAGNIYVAAIAEYQVYKCNSNGIITQFAGSGSDVFTGDGGLATSAGIFDVKSLTLDSNYLYLSSTSHCTVRRVEFTTNIITTYAGTGVCGAIVASGVATSVLISTIHSIWMDTRTNDLFATQPDLNVILRVDSAGIISSFAGDGGSCCSGFGELAVHSSIGSPRGLTGDTVGNIYFAPLGAFVVLKVERITGRLQSFAGDGSSGFIGTIQFPYMHSDGVLYYGDLNNYVLAKICAEGEEYYFPTASPTATLAPTTYTPTAVPTLAVNSSCCYGVNNIEITEKTIAGHGYKGEANTTDAPLNSPLNVWVDDNDIIYFTEVGNHIVRKVDQSGNIDYFAGVNVDLTGFGGDGMDATSTAVYFDLPWGITGDTAGNVYITDSNNMRVRKVSASDHIITTVAGNGTSRLFSGATNPLLDTGLGYIFAIDIDPSNRYLFVVSSSLCVIWRLDLQQEVAERYAGNGNCVPSELGSFRTETGFEIIRTMWLNPSNGEIIFSELTKRVYNLIQTDGIIIRFAGNRTPVYSESDQATSSGFTVGSAITGDTLGNVYLSGYNDFRIRKVCRSTGKIEVMYGNGSASILNRLYGMYFHAKSDSLYFADTGMNSVKKLSLSGSFAANPTIIAGEFGILGSAVEGALAVNTRVGSISSVWVDSSDQIYFSDTFNSTVHRIGMDGIVSTIMRSIDARDIVGDTAGNIYVAAFTENKIFKYSKNGSLTHFAGSGSDVFTGDGGLATSAGIFKVKSLTLDSDYLYLSSTSHCTVRRVELTTNIITTYAGTGVCGTIIVTGVATSVDLAIIHGIWMDTSSSDLFISQDHSNIILRVDSGGIVSLFAGDSGRCCSGFGELAVHSSIGSPLGLTGDTAGNIYFASLFSFMVMKIERATGRLQKFAGNGDSGYIGATQFLHMHSDGVLYYGDLSNYVLATICTEGEAYNDPSPYPTSQPSRQPTTQPSLQPTSQSSMLPSSIPSSIPSTQPSIQPSKQPYAYPTTSPTTTPSSFPSVQPSKQPTTKPSITPSSAPTVQPSQQPTSIPSTTPSSFPSAQPSQQPSSIPSENPSALPSSQPSQEPSLTPSSIPSSIPSTQPSHQPTAIPSKLPSSTPTAHPSQQPISTPSAIPSATPTEQPSLQPTTKPSKMPSSTPTFQPSMQPLSTPSAMPSSIPSAQPSQQPTTAPSMLPSSTPSTQPSQQPTTTPSTMPSSVPSAQPSMRPSTQSSLQPSMQPSTQPSPAPSSLPSSEPSLQPSTQPSKQPSAVPSSKPTNVPSVQPSLLPSAQPSTHPSSSPSTKPSLQPSFQPISRPSSTPSSTPTLQPSDQPSIHPTVTPSTSPSSTPSMQPSTQPTSIPSSIPSKMPSIQPAAQPSYQPSSSPSLSPSSAPTSQPSVVPSRSPSSYPTIQPSVQPSLQPTIQDSACPSLQPTSFPTVQLTLHPTTQPSSLPSIHPSSQPTKTPTSQPTSSPTSQPSNYPTATPSTQPSIIPTSSPSIQPSVNPSSQPSTLPSVQPSVFPTSSPSTQPSSQPSATPSSQPTSAPTTQPSNQPTSDPSSQPSSKPSTGPTGTPTCIPTSQPTNFPSVDPTTQPTALPTTQPSMIPTRLPSTQPSSSPSNTPSQQPTNYPSFQPTVSPTFQPSAEPSQIPSGNPSSQPSSLPSIQPVALPTTQPSVMPSTQPLAEPSGAPSSKPSTQPSTIPSIAPTMQPSSAPTSTPTQVPSLQPIAIPSAVPTCPPSTKPTAIPSSPPTSLPSSVPSMQPVSAPSNQPSADPTLLPTSSPTSLPSSEPSLQPSTQPSSTPTSSPTIIPSGFPTVAPTQQPSSVPTMQDTTSPSSSPTIQPSLQPTAFPSSMPTVSPSCTPSSHPSAQPTTSPSSAPTASPTLKRGNTRRPTQAPTQSPTFTVSQLWKRKLDETLVLDSETGTNKVVERVSYFSMQLPGSSTSLYGSCSSWRSIATSSLPSLTISYLVDYVVIDRIRSLDEYYSTSSILCADAEQATAIVDAFIGAASRDTTVSVDCGAHKWQIKSCYTGSPSPSICADCDDPCSLNSQCSENTVAPCSPDQCTSEDGGSVGIQLLSVGLKDIESAPGFVSLSQSNSSKTSITLTTESTGPGSVYCAAFEIAGFDSNGASYIPSSSSEIVLQGNTAIIGSNNQSVVEIRDLDAATSYRVYCMSVSPVGVEMLLDESITNTLEAATDCCISISVKTTSSFAQEGEAVNSFVTIDLESRPRYDLTLRIRAFRVSDDEEEVLVSPNPFFPSVMKIPGLAGGGAVSLSSSLSAMSDGFYTYTVEFSGITASRFQVEYAANERSFSVLQADEPPPAPALSTAAFSPDGSFISIAFDANTDKGGVSNQFACGSLFDFSCAASSVCRWLSFSTIHAFVDGSDGCVGVGSTISLSTVASVKALCSSSTAAGGCDTADWSVSSTSIAVAVKSPASPVLPSVSIAAPSTISECDSLTLDVSGSTGSGGRQWASVAITVETQAVQNVTDLQSLLKSVYDVSRPIVIPASLLQAGFGYNIVVQLCNFIGGCSRSNRRVSVVASVIPTISLPGQVLRTIKSNQILRIASNAYVANCGGTSSQRYTLSYEWRILRSGVRLLDLENESQDPSRLRLGSFALDVGVLYDVQLLVTINENSLSALAAIKVFVQQGAIIAVVRGGSARSIRVGESMRIDASQSYDEDVQSLVGVASGLSFDWSCAQIASSFNDTCSNILIYNDAVLSAEIFVAVATSSAAGAQARVTLTITDSSLQRSAQSTVLLSVLAALSPSVSLESNLVASGVMNAEKQLTLRGSVSFPIGYNGTSVWSIDDASVTLSAIAKSPISRTFAASTVATSTEMYLVLAPNSLPVGFSYTFSLTAIMSQATSTSAAGSVLVVVNAPPLVGSFSIDPSSGVALLDEFQFIAAEWIDSDLPLLYQFGYETTGGEYLVLSSKSLSAFSRSALPAGLKSSGSTVNCGVQVFDSYSAPSAATATVIVSEGEKFNTSQSQQYINILLEEGSSSADGIKQANALGSYLLNAANCTLAPDCAALNRLDCFRTDHTCGDCLSDEFIGQDGDANEACELISSFATTSRRRRLSDSCVDSDECFGFLTCESGSCSRAAKSCIANCSGHGYCYFADGTTGDEVEFCPIGDSSCEAVCECDVEFVGSGSCSLSSTELLEKQESRLRIISSIFSLIALEEADVQAVEGWLSSLQTVAQVADELSASGASALLEVANLLIEKAIEAEVGTDLMLSLLQTIDVAIQSIKTSGLRRRRLLRRVLLESGSTEDDMRLARQLNTDVAFNSTLVASILEFLDSYSSFIEQNLLPGQDSVQSTQSQLRLFVQVIAQTDLQTTDGSQLELALPRSRLEEVTEASSQQSVRLPLEVADLANASSFNISMRSIAPLLLLSAVGDDSTDQFYSEAVAVKMSQIPCTSTSNADACSIQIVLKLSPILAEKIREFANRSSSIVGDTSFITDCSSDDTTSKHLYTCPDGYRMVVDCDGESGELTSICPEASLAPVCNALVGNVPAESGCAVVSYTADNVTCACPLQALQRRHLQGDDTDGVDDDGSSDSGEYSVSYVAMLEEVQDSFVSTIQSADDLNARSAKDGWVAILTVGLFAAAVVLSIAWSRHADARADSSTLATSEVKSLQSSANGKALQRTANLTVLTSRNRNRSQPNQPPPIQQRPQPRQRAVKKTTSVKDPNLLMAEEALPQILSSRSLSHRISDEMKSRHRWFGIYYHYSAHFPRVLRVVSLTTNVVVMLFIQSLTYTLTNPDNGECETFKSRSSCLAEESPYATGESKCNWDGKRCSFVEPDADLKVILFVALFSAILATPLSLLADWVTMTILSAKTAETTTEETVATTATVATGAVGDINSTERKHTSGIFSTASDRLQLAVSTFSRKSSASRAGTRVFDLIGAKEEFTSLKSKLLQYRTALTDIEKREFDLLWGLNSSGEFKNDNNRNRNTFLAPLINAITKKQNSVDVGSRILQDLLVVRQTAKSEQTRFQMIDAAGGHSSGSSNIFASREKRKRLLYLFQCDLLPGVSGKILEAKGQRDFAVAPTVPRWMKLAGWAFIVLLNASLLFYILLFAMTQSSNRQGAWAQSFMIWLVMQVFFISTLVVLLVHVILPSLIMKDVTKIKQRLLENIRDFNRNIKKNSDTGAEAKSEEDGAFNAANFLFVSTRVAKEQPELKEARMILEFTTPWPKQSYQHVANVSKAYSKKFTALTRSSSIILIFVITTFLGVPPVVQDIFLEIASTAVVGYTVLLHIDLYYIFPLLAFFPMLLVAVIVHFIMRSSKAEAQMRLRKLLADDTADIAEIHPQLDSDKQQQQKQQLHGGKGVVDVEHSSDDQSNAADDKSEFERAADDFEANGSRSGDATTDSDEEMIHNQYAADSSLRIRYALNTHRSLKHSHVDRKQSVQQGIDIARQMKASLQQQEEEEDTLTSADVHNRQLDGSSKNISYENNSVKNSTDNGSSRFVAAGFAGSGSFRINRIRPSSIRLPEEVKHGESQSSNNTSSNLPATDTIRPASAVDYPLSYRFASSSLEATGTKETYRSIRSPQFAGAAIQRSQVGIIPNRLGTSPRTFVAAPVISRIALPTRPFQFTATPTTVTATSAPRNCFGDVGNVSQNAINYNDNSSSSSGDDEEDDGEDDSDESEASTIDSGNNGHSRVVLEEDNEDDDDDNSDEDDDDDDDDDDESSEQ